MSASTKAVWNSGGQGPTHDGWPIVGWFRKGVITASTSNYIISAINPTVTVIGGVTIGIGQDFALLGQTDPSENGIYTTGSAAGATLRRADWHKDQPVGYGTCFEVLTGNLAGTIWSADSAAARAAGLPAFVPGEHDVEMTRCTIDLTAVGVSIKPAADETYDLGTTALRWLHAYIQYLYMPGGNAIFPAIAPQAQPGNGIYFPTDHIGFGIGGTGILDLAASLATLGVPLELPNGSAAAPALTASNDPDTGIYFDAANGLFFATGGVGRIKVGTTGNLFHVTDKGGSFGSATNRATALFAVAGAITSIASLAADTTLDTATHYTVIVDATGAARTITLPTAVGNAGRRFEIKKKDASANAVIIAGNGSELVDGANTLSLTTQYEAVTVVSNGTQWWAV